MRLVLLLGTLAILLLAGCGANLPPQATPSLDIKSLALDIDVQMVAGLQGRQDVLLLDVREPDEYAAGHIPGTINIPLGSLPQRLGEIAAGQTVVVTCRSGNRSAQAVTLLRQRGFADVHNMRGGILAWQQAGYRVAR